MGNNIQTARKKWLDSKMNSENEIDEVINKICDWIGANIEENAKKKYFLNPFTIYHNKGRKLLIMEGKKLKRPYFFIGHILEKTDVAIVFEAIKDKLEKEEGFNVKYVTKHGLLTHKSILIVTIL